MIRVARSNKIKDAQLNLKFRYCKGHTYTKKLFIVYLKIKVIWVSCNPTNNTCNTSTSRKWSFILLNPFKVACASAFTPKEGKGKIVTPQWSHLANATSTG